MPSQSSNARTLVVLLATCFFGFSFYAPFHVVGQQADTEKSPASAENSRPVNLFIINSEDNEIANKSVSNSLKSIREKNAEWLGKVVSVTINGSDAKDDLDKICTAWDAALQENPTEIPDVVLDTTRSGLGAETVNSFTAALGIPTLSGQFGQAGDLRHWRDLSEDQLQYLVQIMPPADLIPEAVRQMAYYLNISNLAVIFDESFVMEHKYKSLLLNVPTRHVIVPAKNSEKEARAQLSRLRKLDIVNYFVLAGESVLTNTLNAGQALNFTGEKYGWYALTQDEFQPHCDGSSLQLIFFKPEMETASQQRISELASRGLLPKPVLSSAFYYDLARIAVAAMKSAIDAKLWPLEPKQMACDSFNGKNTPTRNFDFIGKLKSVNSDMQVTSTFADVAWGRRNGEHRASFNMNGSLIAISNGNPVSTSSLGMWPASINSSLKGMDEWVMKKHVALTSYRIVTVAKPPFMIYNAETNEWSGFCIDLIDEIAHITNFTYEITIAPDGRFGSMDENGNWDGMIKELKDKRADIALGALSVMAERENVVDFTVPYYDLVGISILMQRVTTPTSLFKFLTVLENNVWLCILGSYLFTSFLMWLFDRWSPYSYQNNREKYRDDDDKREFTLKECLWFCMTSLTPQGGGEAPKNLSGRLVAATWWLFGFIIIASYTANLAAFLTVSRLDTPVESLDDLSKQYKIQYAPIHKSEAYTYFERMANIERRFYDIWKDMSLNDSLSDVERSKLAVWDYPVSDKYTKMFQAMKEAKFPANLSEALDRVQRKTVSTEFAFIGDATDIRYLYLTECNYVIVGEEFSRKPYAIAVQQGSPLKDQLNNAILQLLNERKLERMKNKWWSTNIVKKDCKKNDQGDGISIENIGGVFIVIFFGIGLSCSTLAFEYYWYRYRPKHQAKRDLPPNEPSNNSKTVRFTLKPAKNPTFESSVPFGSRF
ncbi:ionotropic receptor 25a [Venturia canescens]|uniref:ionotropic receptor 25a n=1 Tax=Venturia canescens TaxID=32260 RepID=UPI001C9D0915|nr:ionotropic receptor 25a [Venturia canescens]